MLAILNPIFYFFYLQMDQLSEEDVVHLVEESHVQAYLKERGIMYAIFGKRDFNRFSKTAAFLQWNRYSFGSIFRSIGRLIEGGYHVVKITDVNFHIAIATMDPCAEGMWIDYKQAVSLLCALFMPQPPSEELILKINAAGGMSLWKVFCIGKGVSQDEERQRILGIFELYANSCNTQKIQEAIRADSWCSYSCLIETVSEKKRMYNLE